MKSCDYKETRNYLLRNIQESIPHSVIWNVEATVLQEEPHICTVAALRSLLIITISDLIREDTTDVKLSSLNILLSRFSSAFLSESLLANECLSNNEISMANWISKHTNYSSVSNLIFGLLNEIDFVTKGLGVGLGVMEPVIKKFGFRYKPVKENFSPHVLPIKNMTVSLKDWNSIIQKRESMIELAINRGSLIVEKTVDMINLHYPNGHMVLVTDRWSNGEVHYEFESPVIIDSYTGLIIYLNTTEIGILGDGISIEATNTDIMEVLYKASSIYLSFGGGGKYDHLDDSYAIYS